MKILSVVGARPNFMKVAPIAKALKLHSSRVRHILVHTGQHYDVAMSGSFLRTLEVPEPDINLGIGSGTHAEQTGRVMIAIEPVFKEAKPDVVIVVGDVNSTLAAALAAKKLLIPVAHVEAGLRSFDMTMPEEINRICTDAISDYLFTSERLADENLKREGIPGDKIHFVGNVMIDTLLAHREAATAMRYHERFGLQSRGFGVLTLHRPANVDDRDTLSAILRAILDGVGDLPIVFPMHPRTRARIAEFGCTDLLAPEGAKRGLIATAPLDYLELLSLNCSTRMVLTDSGGLQEETTALGVPCVTLRPNTERPITVEEGTNVVAGTSRDGILKAIDAALQAPSIIHRRPEYWDGKAADRIVAQLLR
jgi:UDP-N-acetylglucosamine 2-epimerase (non-hydrolysing)